MFRLFAFAAILLVPTLALAEPAVVKRFEASVHAAPDATSEVIGLLIEDQEISVSETAEEGFRRVRLPDGSVGWVEEAALSFVTPDAEPRTYPSHAPLRESPAATPSAKIYVKDLKHLAELVVEDEVVAPMAQRLNQRHVTSQVVWWGSLMGGLAATTAGMLIPGDSCTTFSTGEYCSWGPTNYTLIYGGLGLSLLGMLASYAITPKRNDLLDVINTWNVRNPEEPFELTGDAGSRH